jgi:hypothetical protein
MMQGKPTSNPVWPDWDTIAHSVNNRGNLNARASDDPLFGVVITQDMMSRAHDAAFGKKDTP